MFIKKPDSFDVAGAFFFLRFVFLLGLLAVVTHSSVSWAVSRADQEAVLMMEVQEKFYTEVVRARSVNGTARAIDMPPSPHVSDVRVTLQGYRLPEVIPSVGKFIAADLHSMKLFLFENGTEVATYPIAAKGRPGSYWETPTGYYEVRGKKESHFSSFGLVYMPYSMQFFGNFFIHGWPYYKDGTPVSAGYSGGCIRLSTQDAFEVYQFADVQTPLFVFNDAATTTAPSVLLRSSSLPKVSARAFLVADVHSGAVFAEQGLDESLPIASITKLITAVVASETLNFERSIAVLGTGRNQTEGDYGSIDKGEFFTLAELMYPLLLESNNAVAYSIADTYGTRAFIEAMNTKVAAIGAPHTTFADASGVDSRNVSTVHDLFTIARYVYANRSFILSLSRQGRKRTAADDGSVYTFVNKHPYKDDLAFLGGKTGYTTAAQETMLSLFSIPFSGGTSTIAIIVLGSSDRLADTAALRSWFTEAAYIPL